MLKGGSLHLVMQSLAKEDSENKSNAVDEDAQQIKFLFVRHPFERLVSAYHEKFVVNRVQVRILYSSSSNHNSLS